ncbi:MAG TPA: SPASM domain-containing protein [Polyangia bacterium]|nr:SPASM domain-containing protein [Polyangia bacterium]
MDAGAWRVKADNLRRAFAHYRARETQLSSLPFRFILELTQNCNYKCFMCAQAWEPKYQRFDAALNMPLDTFVRSAEQLFPTAIMVDLHGFGETTILPHWPDVVDYLARWPFIEWNLVTNLSLTRDDVWDKMIALDFRLGFSCDGASKQTFEHIRVGSNFERTLHNLAVIRDARRRHGRGTIYFLSTIQRSAVHELRALVELAHEYDVPEVQFKIVQGGHDVDLEGQLRSIGDLSMSRHVDAAVDAALELGVRVTFNDPVFVRRLDPEKLQRVSAPLAAPPSPSSFWGAAGAEEVAPYAAMLDDSFRVAVNKNCFKPFSFVYLTYQSDVGPCNCMMPDPPPLGNLARESLAEIWNNGAFQKFRREILDGVPSDERCQWCFEHRVED